MYVQRSSNIQNNLGTDLRMSRFHSERAHRAAPKIHHQAWRTAMKTLMATAAAISLIAGVSVATAQNAPATTDKGNTTMDQSTAPKVKASTHKTRMHQTMRMKHRSVG